MYIIYGIMLQCIRMRRGVADKADPGAPRPPATGAIEHDIIYECKHIYIYTHIYIYIYVYLYTCMYIYIYIYTERERDRER